MGLSRDIPLAANLIAGLGVGADGAASSAAAMESWEFVLLDTADGAKAEAEVVRRDAVRMLVVFMMIGMFVLWQIYE